MEKIASPPSDTPSVNNGEEKAQKTEFENVDIDTGERIQITPEQDRLITKKFDRHIIPWLFGLWLLAFIDRSNIGNAKIDGLAKDLGILKGTKFNIALAIFYVPYIIVDGILIIILFTS
jgi:hypothetical protein